MYIYHALINALCAHMMHVNVNMTFYTHVQHSPTKTIYIKYYTEKQTNTCTTCTTHTHTETYIYIYVTVITKLTSDIIGIMKHPQLKFLLNNCFIHSVGSF